MRVLILVACLSLVYLSEACSCGSSNAAEVYLCTESRDNDNIIEVKILSIVEKPAPEPAKPKRQRFLDLDLPPRFSAPLTTEPPNYVNYYEEREVDAVITKVYKGSDDAVVGAHIRVKSWMMDSMCGVGYWLYPEKTLIIATNNLAEKSLNLCEYTAFKDLIPEEVIEKHNCSCLGLCSLVEDGVEHLVGECGNHVHYPWYWLPADWVNNAYCDGECKWQNVPSLSACRYT